VKEDVEDGITPDGLIQPIHDPDAHSSSEGEKEVEEREGKREGQANAIQRQQCQGKTSQQRQKKLLKERWVHQWLTWSCRRNRFHHNYLITTEK
jgi:hypothetical protein